MPAVAEIDGSDRNHPPKPQKVFRIPVPTVSRLPSLAPVLAPVWHRSEKGETSLPHTKCGFDGGGTDGTNKPASPPKKKKGW